MSRRFLIAATVFFLVMAGVLIYNLREPTDKIPETISQSAVPGSELSTAPLKPTSPQSPEVSSSQQSAVMPTKLSPAQHVRYKKLFPEGKVLAEELSGFDTEGNQIQTQVLEVKLKYPKVKWVERVNRTTGEVASQETYVATHVLLERPESTTEEEFQTWIDRAQGKILGRVGDRTVRVSVVMNEGLEPSAQDLLHAVDRLKERLEKESAGKAVVDFDFVRFTR